MKIRNIAPCYVPERFRIKHLPDTFPHITRKHLKPEITRFGPERNAPHAATKRIPTYDKQSKAVTWKLSGCDCKGCTAYLLQIEQVNPQRHHAMLSPWPSCICGTCENAREQPMFMKRKQLHPSEAYRRVRDKATHYRGY